MNVLVGLVKRGRRTAAKNSHNTEWGVLEIKPHSARCGTRGVRKGRIGQGQKLKKWVTL